MRIRPEIASTTDPTISPSCATWLSTSCERTTPSLPCVESSSSQAGMTHIWPSLSLNFEMRLPCSSMLHVSRSSKRRCRWRTEWSTSLLAWLPLPRSGQARVPSYPICCRHCSDTDTRAFGKDRYGAISESFLLFFLPLTDRGQSQFDGGVSMKSSAEGYSDRSEPNWSSACPSLLALIGGCNEIGTRNVDLQA